ncbi:putative leucine-rich repeat-containing protein DDB_G0290503 [Syngnathoides biaculeatus]|uniref:putative leucine-rich repeat-containing protein DDB_G0290503 n=1 Tax=Syngnathoides biaculeatus TaxID=300417 RepID=UPI002ADD9B49|nr:putative leucine-rich repeat-containing protein DDB_G0290503 [Syngnathoides biaculeatus]
MAHPEYQDVKMEIEKKDLRAQFKHIHENITPTEENLHNKEWTQHISQTITAQTENADLTSELNSQTKTENENFSKQVEVLEENKASFTQQKMLLCEKLARLECRSVKMETHLRMQIKFLQENEDALIKQNEALNNEVVELERWGGMIEKQNENLKAQVKVLKENENIINEMLETVMANLTHVETQRRKDQADMYCIRTKLQTVRCQLQGQNELLSRVDHGEFHLQQAYAENEHLSNKLRELEDEYNYLKKQNNAIREELAEHTSVRDQQSEHTAQLEAAVKDQQYVIYSKDVLLAEQKREITCQNEAIEELNSLVSSLKQTIHDLRSQLEVNQMEKKFLEETAHKTKIVSGNQLDLKTEREDVMVEMKAPLQNQHSLFEQKRVLKDTLTLSDSPSLKMGTENEELRTQMKELQENQVRMTGMNSDLQENLSHLESGSAKMETENEHLKAQAECHKENENICDEKTETILSDFCQFKSHIEKDDIGVPQSKMDTETFLFHLQDQGDLKEGLDNVQTEVEAAEQENSGNSNEKDNILKINQLVSAELGDHKSVDHQPENNTHMKTGFHKHKVQMEESGILLLYIKDDLLPMKSKEIHHGDKYGDGPLFITLGQSIRNFQRKLKRMEEILTADDR